MAAGARDFKFRVSSETDGRRVAETDRSSRPASKGVACREAARAFAGTNTGDDSARKASVATMAGLAG